MCTGGVACFHGTCTTTAIDKTANEVCVCDELYSGSQCGYRSGLLFFELPLAAVLVFVFVIMGLRLSATAHTMLPFTQSDKDFFEFPRVFKPAERVNRRLQPFVGTWEGPMEKRLPIHKQSPVTRVLVVLVVVLEMLPLVQIAAMAFLPVVSWPTNSKAPAKFLRLLLLHPVWSHQEPSEYPRMIFYLAVGAFPALLVVACALGIKRFPLFKPQPMTSPAEDLSSLVLRAFSSWAVLPVMIALLLPLECLFIGYERRVILFEIPIYDPTCFTWLGLGHISLGFGATVLYTLLASGVGIQLNCESSKPQPTMWTDARYTAIVHGLHAPLALSVVAFGNSNPLALCLCSMMAGLFLVVVNAWMRPCLYSIVNWLRVYGASVASWTGLVGSIASLTDDPRNKSTFEIWSLGAIALTAVTFSALFVQYTEELWFMLSVLKGRRWTPSTGRNIAAVLAKGRIEDEGTKAGLDSAKAGDTERTRIVHVDFKSLKPKLPPLHVMKKRSRRAIAPV